MDPSHGPLPLPPSSSQKDACTFGPWPPGSLPTGPVPLVKRNPLPGPASAVSLFLRISPSNYLDIPLPKNNIPQLLPMVIHPRDQGVQHYLGEDAAMNRYPLEVASLLDYSVPEHPQSAATGWPGAPLGGTRVCLDNRFLPTPASSTLLGLNKPNFDKTATSTSMMRPLTGHWLFCFSVHGSQVHGSQSRLLRVGPSP